MQVFNVFIFAHVAPTVSVIPAIAAFHCLGMESITKSFNRKVYNLRNVQRLDHQNIQLNQSVRRRNVLIQDLICFIKDRLKTLSSKIFLPVVHFQIFQVPKMVYLRKW